MTDKTKKIIAREGVMLFVYLAVWTFVAVVIPIFLLLIGRLSDEGWYMCIPYEKAVPIGYLIILFIRFIIWAGKKLRMK